MHDPTAQAPVRACVRGRPTRRTSSAAVSSDFLAARGYWQCCGEYRRPSEATCRHCGRAKGANAATSATKDTDRTKDAPQGNRTARRWAPYRSRTEKLAAEYLGPTARYEPLRIKLADSAWYTPDFVVYDAMTHRNETGVAYEVKHARHDPWNSRKTQRRVLKVAAERLAELGIVLRLLVLDGQEWRTEEP